MICEKCKNNHDGSYGSGRFCSSFCARSFSTSEKRDMINKKVSQKLKGNKCIKGGLLKLCDYGCGQEAKYQLKNGKWCCSDSHTSCPEVRNKNSKGVKIARKDGKIFNFPKNAHLKGHESFRKNLQEKYDLLSFDEKPLVERARIILHGQNYRCNICNIKNWCGKPLTLHLDHIDGNTKNEKRENTRYICPNCHSQTKTYCGRNIKNKPVTKKKFKEALSTSINIHQALKKCGLVPKGANYNRAKDLLNEMAEWRNTVDA